MAPPTSILPPSSAFKYLLRQSYQQKTCLRCLSTVPAVSPPSWQPPPLPPTRSPYAVTQGRTHEPAKKIKTYPPPPSLRNAHPEPLKSWTTTHLHTLDPTSTRTALFSPTNADAPKPGDILHVTFRSNSPPFSGVLLSIRRRGVDTGILLRNKLVGTSVEMWVKIYSPQVSGVEIVKRAERRARRGRLYFLRKPKHDRGSVEGEVREYLQRRRLIRSGALGGEVERGGKGGGKGRGRSGVGAR